jgi:hypothetical protein
MEPLSSVEKFEWDFDIPTGNIKDKSMAVAVWCKINSATYYAGTHEMPKMKIEYDGNKTVTATATKTTDWQLLSVILTPTTEAGKINLTLSGMTDGLTTDAYIYFDDFSVLYPAGYKLDLGGMDIWDAALPVTPPIATVMSAADVWAVDPDKFGSDTVGDLVKKIEQKVDDNQALIISK